MTDKLYPFLSATYCVLLLLANIVSAKLIPLTESFAIPAGLLLTPLSCLLCALVTELYGARNARTMVFGALVLMLLSSAIIQLAVVLPNSNAENQHALEETLGLSPLILFSSLCGYATSQSVEISLYAFIKHWTGDPLLWLRNTGAVIVSQLVDTIVVNCIFLAWGLGLPFEEVCQIIIFAYFYKLTMGMMSTPLLYLLLAYFKNGKKAFTH